VFAASANSNRETPASLPTEYDTLTPEQAAALGHYRARWAAIRRSTEPADRNAAEQGVRHVYHAAALKPPVQCVWCEGPAALSDLTQRIARADGANVKSALMHRLRRQVASLVRRHVSQRGWAAVESVGTPPTRSLRQPTTRSCGTCGTEQCPCSSASAGHARCPGSPPDQSKGLDEDAILIGTDRRSPRFQQRKVVVAEACRRHCESQPKCGAGDPRGRKKHRGHGGGDIYRKMGVIPLVGDRVASGISLVRTCTHAGIMPEVSPMAQAIGVLFRLAKV
jgi:hypothetical protein